MEKQDLVFIVDDNEIFLDLLSSKLGKSLKCDVKVFTNAQDCLLNIDKEPDLIITDYFLDSTFSNNMNGDDLLKKVKHLNPKIPVIVCSAKRSSEGLLNLLNEQGVDFISKNDKTINGLVANIRDLYQEAKHKERKEWLKENKIKMNITILLYAISLFLVDFFWRDALFTYILCTAFVFIVIAILYRKPISTIINGYV